MKTRIISGAVMAIIVAGVLALSTVFPIAVYIGLAICAGIAAYELLWSTGAVRVISGVAIAVAYMALTVFTQLGKSNQARFYTLTCIYVAALIVIALLRHENLPAANFGFAVGLPIIVSCGFCALCKIIVPANGDNGIFYFIFLFNFASIADMGAYFVGSAIGKHKLAPVISPKKSIEGAVGGMVCSLLFTVIFVLGFNHFFNTSFVLWKWLVFTPVFVFIGIVGDLIASYIKRSFGIKDYGNLIPGHGGILDRMDSILLVAPFLQLFIELAGVTK